VLSRVGRLDPILSFAIQQGVQDAIDQVEHMIAAARRTETRDRRTTALASIRSFWAVYNGLEEPFLKVNRTAPPVSPAASLTQPTRPRTLECRSPRFESLQELEQRAE
jgi:hypothetical protein